MSHLVAPPFLWRASYDGALCTIRRKFAEGEISGTKGEWLGVEWDDPSRGKHDGSYHGVKLFDCKSKGAVCASFIRPSRKADQEFTILQAIEHKYGGGVASQGEEAVIISGKVAEEVGFDKIARAQSALEDLRVVVIDQLVIYGICPRGASAEQIKAAQADLARRCPNIVELDLSYNTIEDWQAVEDVCAALPKVKLLRLNGIRFRNLLVGEIQPQSPIAFTAIHELHLNGCLVRPREVVELLACPSGPRFPALKTLWLSQNELGSLHEWPIPPQSVFPTVKQLMLENNHFENLNGLRYASAVFPQLNHISFQSNMIETPGSELRASLLSNSPYIFPDIESINLSHNKIPRFDFVDTLHSVLPNLRSLRISQNPLYSAGKSEATGTFALETSYYLTLARIPTLTTLNYTNITVRERDEGEIYYLSVAEQALRSILIGEDLNNEQRRAQCLQTAQIRFPRYEPLCMKHDRESILDAITSYRNSDLAMDVLRQESARVNPPGSIAARLAEVTFCCPSLDDSSSAANTTAPQVVTSLTRSLPTSLPTSWIFGLISRIFRLVPLQFRVIYESRELDPVKDDLSTRSQLNRSNTQTDNKTSGEKIKGRWADWGDWDVDRLVDNTDVAANSSAPEVNNTGDEGTWTAEGHFVKNGRKWKRREIELLMSIRPWGDWLDLDPNARDKTVRLRIEPFERQRSPNT